MRGKAIDIGPIHGELGITPAYAGKSRPETTQDRQQGDHPRVCGEKSEAVFLLVALQGSPPRMRGKVVAVALDFFVGGITPAYAGKRVCHDTTSFFSQDHPRVCGEKTKKIP